ncbi:MAG: helix-turn-helix transcriptional regulator [Candidatus Acidiferrales bacterium]
MISMWAALPGAALFFGPAVFNFQNMTPSELRKSRISVHLSQAELGRRVGVSQMAISLWERGMRALQWERVEAIRRAVEVQRKILEQVRRSLAGVD